MPRYFPGSEIVLQVSVYDADCLLTDAGAISLFWRMKHWNQRRSDNTGTVINVTTGIYQSTIVPLEGGNLYYRWEVTTPDMVQEDTINVKDTQFPAQV